MLLRLEAGDFSASNLQSSATIMPLRYATIGFFGKIGDNTFHVSSNPCPPLVLVHGRFPDSL